MADLSDVNSAQSAKIIGADSSGVEQTPVQSTANGGLHTNLRNASGTEMIGQKTMAASIPVVVASDQDIAISILNGGVGANINGRVTTNATSAIRDATYTEQTTNAQRSLVSSSASDASAGTGARTVRITYLDSTGAGPFTETVTLNGTTPVNTTNTNICFIERMDVLTVGSTGASVGTISLKAATAGGGATIGTIVATKNQTFWAHHYTPAGKTTRILSMIYTGNIAALFSLQVQDPTSTTNPIQTFNEVYMSGQGGGGAFQRIFNNNRDFSGPRRLTMFVTPSANGGTYIGEIDYSDY